MDNGIPIDVSNICETLFMTSPKPKHSIQLMFENVEGETNVKDIFFILLELFEIGMKTLYGDENGKVNLESLTHDNFKRINEYFNSIGFEVMYEISLRDDMKNEVKNGDDGDNLEDYFLYLKTQNYKYRLSFTFCKPD